MGGAYNQLEAALARMPSDLGRTPRAVIMVSAHWEESQFTVQTNAAPPMLYDYGGFPDFAYEISSAWRTRCRSADPNGARRCRHRDT